MMPEIAAMVLSGAGVDEIKKQKKQMDWRRSRSQKRDRCACKWNRTLSQESCSSSVVSASVLASNIYGRTPLKKLASLTLIAISAFSFAAWADPPTRYQVTRLTSDISGAANLDPVLQNAWGVAFTPGGSPFWVADNATGCSTLYDGAGIPQPHAAPLTVKIPLPVDTIPPSPPLPVHPTN